MLTLVGDVGGVIGLILGARWPQKIWLVVAGTVLAAALFCLIVVLHRGIERLIRTKEERNA